MTITLFLCRPHLQTTVLVIAILLTVLVHWHYGKRGIVSEILHKKNVSKRWTNFIILSLALFITLLWVCATGGIFSPLIGLFLLPIILAAVRLELFGGTMMALAVSFIILIALLPWRGPFLNGEFISDQMGHILVFNLVGAFSGLVFRRFGIRTRKLERRNTQAVALDNITRMVESAYDLETILDLVPMQIRMIFPDSSANAIFLAKNSGNSLELRGHYGISQNSINLKRIPLDLQEQNWSPCNGTSLLIKDSAKGTSHTLTALMPEARSAMWIPLLCMDETIGLLGIFGIEPSKFSEEDLQTAELFASRISFPIHHARQRERLERLASTDGLTHLYNHRYFHERLSEEIDKGNRYGRPVSLIFIDIDNFKKVNDNYGHLAGDMILKQTARLIRQTIRQVDRAARYGGDEIAIICPETNPTSALFLAKRLKNAVSKEDILLPNGEKYRISISVGVAGIPLDGTDKQTLIRSADAALYEAKNNGKNQVRIHTEPDGTQAYG